MPRETATLGLLAPALFNPAVGAAVGIGLLGYGLWTLLKDDDAEKDQATPALPEPVGEQGPGEKAIPEDIDDIEAIKKAAIREHMSLLGKRSAAARSMKRNAERG